jgi:hypothetical protein
MALRGEWSVRREDENIEWFMVRREDCEKVVSEFVLRG